MRRVLICSLILCAATIAVSGDDAPNSEMNPRMVEPMSAPLALRGISAPAEVLQFSKAELVLDLSATYDNPFDPDDLRIDATFMAPDGSEQVVPGFLYRPMVRSDDGVAMAGEDAFMVRFTPNQEGTYRYRVAITDRTGTVESEEGRLSVTGSDADGFVRRAEDPHYFAFDSGRGYFALGENVCWGSDVSQYDEWFGRLAEAGCNYARLWLGPFTLFTLERSPGGPDDYAGLTRYDMVNAYNLEYVLELAERHGIYLMLCIDSFNCLRASDPYPAWATWPYNAENGGPCETPEDYFTSDEARSLYQKRLRYIVARYGYSPNVLSWEFWNEVDIIERYVQDDVVSWHQDMARHLRELDPYDHLITTSFARSDGDPAVDGLPEMDYVQTHNYGSRDCAVGLLHYTREKIEAFGKPHYVGEYGTGAMAEGNDADTEGVHLHNGIWATSLAESAGCGQLWWWDSYVQPNDLYYHFAALSAFLADVDFANESLRPTEVGEMRFAEGAEPPEPQDLVIHGRQPSWEPDVANVPTTHTVSRAGGVADSDSVPGILHGLRNHPDLHNPVVLEVDFAQAGEFSVGVHGVSGHGGAALRISVDGEEKLAVDFPDRADSQDLETMGEYDKAYTVEVPAGEHMIEVENTGADWFYCDYTLARYRIPTSPDLQVVAMHNDERALVWVRNVAHNWSNIAAGRAMTPVPESRIELMGLRDGRYEAEVWDTWSGKVTRTETLTCEAGSLWLDVPGLARDMAWKLRAL